jgi:hypothetical protein
MLDLLVAHADSPDRDGPNVTILPSQVHDCLLVFTLLVAVHCEGSEFAKAKSGSRKYCK